MYSELRKYLLLHHELPIPGVGSINLERQPAAFDFANRQILPPAYRIIFREGSVQASRRLYGWLAASLGVTERDAILKFNDFVFELRERLDRGEKLEWQGVGHLNKGLGGIWHFKPGEESIPEGDPVPADKVLRSRSSHSVRVGEDERTSEQMREYLHTEPVQKNTAWAIALILLVISFIALGLYLSSAGLKPGSAGNHSKIKTEEASPAPRYLR